MGDADRPTVRIEGDDGFMHATWSRSGKRVILSVGRSWDETRQVALSPEQAAELASFLAEGPDATVR